jgi:hypothetical protein
MLDVGGQDVKKGTVRRELWWSNVSRSVCFVTLDRANGQRISRGSLEQHTQLN